MTNKLKFLNFLIFGSTFSLVMLLIAKFLSYNVFIPYYNIINIALIITFFSSYIFSIIEENNIEKKEIEEIRKSIKNEFISEFESGKEINIIVRRGFLSIPFVISKNNNWKFIDDKFISNNESFTYDEIMEL